VKFILIHKYLYSVVFVLFFFLSIEYKQHWSRDKNS